MANTLTDITAALKTILEGVSGMGKVHNRERWTGNDTDRFNELFRDDSREVINGWTIRRRAYTPVLSVSAVIANVHEMQLDGYYSFKDTIDTANTFGLLVEGVVNTINTSNFAYAGAWDRLADAEGAHTEIEELDSFASVICHHAVVVVRVEVRA